MITFNFHTKNSIKDFTTDSQNNRFTFQPGNTIKYNNDFFVVEAIEYIVSEETIDQVVICIPK